MEEEEEEEGEGEERAGMAWHDRMQALGTASLSWREERGGAGVRTHNYSLGLWCGVASAGLGRWIGLAASRGLCVCV